jgi:putative transposase
MDRQHFSSGAVFHWQKATYRILRLLPDGKANLEESLTGAVMSVDISVLVQALFNGELFFVVERKSISIEPQTANPAKVLSLSDYPEELVAIARYRLEVILPLLKMQERTFKAVCNRCQEVRNAQIAKPQAHTLQSAVSVSAIYRWIKDYRHSGEDLRALIPSVHERGGKEKSRLCTEVENLADIVIQDKCSVRERITIDDVRCELAVRIAEENCIRSPQEQLSLPSRATLARRIQASPLRQEQGIVGEKGNRQLKQTPYPHRLLERVEIDHTRSDLVVIDDKDNLPLGRLTLTYCLDISTRYPLGYYLGFEPPSYLTVMECLHHAICPKGDMISRYGTEHQWLAYGIPATLVIDNGKEFIGHDLEDACQLLGMVLQYSPVQTPQFKAGIERMFGSLNTMFFHALPGTTFSNPAERGNYDSVEQACVYMSEVDKMLHIFLLDIYAERFHRGLNGIPAQEWKEKMQHGFAPALPPDAAELSILLGRTATRTVQHYGIEFLSLRYNCDSLITLRTRLKGQPAKVKYHPADLSCLHVYDAFEKQYIRVPALDQEYTQGLSLWKHRVIRQMVLTEQDQVDIVALGKAKRKIQNMVEAGRKRKRQSTRSRIARWDTAGKPSRQVVDNPSESTEASTKSFFPAQQTTDSSIQPISLLQDMNWEIGYIPVKHPDPSTEEEQGVKHG